MSQRAPGPRVSKKCPESVPECPKGGDTLGTLVSQSVREIGRDESQSVSSPEKLFKIRDFEHPNF